MSTERIDSYLLGDTPFERRHIGPDQVEQEEMLTALSLNDLESLIASTVPAAIRSKTPLNFAGAQSESEALASLKEILSKNQIRRSLIGQGYYDTVTPPVILRNILENPGWYTQYTPYQAEIAQGRLEALLNFQTMVVELTGLDVANASLLDEGTAAAEGVTLAHRVRGGEKKNKVFLHSSLFPQTVDVIQTRCAPLEIECVIGDSEALKRVDESFNSVVLQYPGDDGSIEDFRENASQLKSLGVTVIACADLLSLMLLTPPGEWGAEIVVGNSQRFGVPYGFGGPHAAFMAVKDEFKRQLPGRLIGVSKDASGKPALRLSLQTREQHIRRDKATSNICTAQVLLAVMASMYAVYHGPEGLKRIALRVNGLTRILASKLKEFGISPRKESFFDTLTYDLGSERDKILSRAESRGYNLRLRKCGAVELSIDERSTLKEISELVWIFSGKEVSVTESALKGAAESIPLSLNRQTLPLKHQVFSRYHSEHEFLRYVHRLQSKDLSLTTSMIPLGSCTMKLNATAEMIPVTWAEVSSIHPFVPEGQTKGYDELHRQLEAMLCEVTGLDACSLQPNAGSQGEYAGLLVIRGYHLSRGDTHRTDCLIPESAHGTNPASAIMAGMKVVPVRCDERGNVDIEDLRTKAEAHKETLAGLMVTYPSTHGVFEEGIAEITEIVHRHGGQVYMDGANLNAQVGLCRAAEFGVDVCHFNLHKTFCIPHGGGGPGMGPICTKAHLAPFLPTHTERTVGGEKGCGAVSAAPWGSASILTISWMYITMMGGAGLRRATEVAILNANYIAHRLEPYYPVLYRGSNGMVAHECILDLRGLKSRAGVEVEDVAKRLMDYGFHAPTVSWPVPGTVMIEPTESETKAEIDRFCDAMIAISGEVAQIERGELPREGNPLKNAPHTAELVTASEWAFAYSREQAAYPAAWLKEYKFWPAVRRVDNVYGDRNLFCVCSPVESYAE